jgi:peptide/nickel transport system substrate-binding protein
MLSLVFNKRLPGFDNPKVRQAFMYAIDREGIKDTLWKGTAEVINCGYRAENLVPQGLNSYPFDPKKARELLAEAKFDTKQEFQVLTYYSDQLTKDILAAVQQNLADVGIKVTPRYVDTPTFVAEYYNKDPKWTLAYVGAGNGPDPDILRLIFATEGTWPAGNNIAAYSNPAVDKAYTDGRAEMDPVKRAKHYQEVCKIMNEDAPNAWLWETVRYGATTGRIGNFVYTPSPGGGRYYSAVEKWYLKK